jgi:flagellar hook protein FlgE
MADDDNAVQPVGMRRSEMGNFSIPLSGLQADAVALDTIGNNLANLNTTAYKGQTTSFEDLFYQQIGESGSGDAIQTGAGVKVSGTTTDFSQGTLSPTTGSSNMALAGNGFFVVQQDGVQSLTRAGDFQLDSSGNLITADGEQVMGYAAVNGAVSQSGGLQPINIPVGANEAAQATQNFSVTANLNSGATTGTAFQTPVQMFDSLGQSHQVTVTYTKTGTNTWSYAVALPSSDATGTPINNTGTLSFDSSGNLITPAATPWSAGMTVTVGTTIVDSNGNIERATSVSGTGTAGGSVPAWSATAGTTVTDNAGPNQVVWTNLGAPSSVAGPITFPGMTDGANSLSFNWDLNGNTSSPAITQLAAASSNNGTSQDGFTSGVYQGFTVDTNGVITAQFSNERTSTIGQVAVATVANVAGLTVTGDNNFATTAASGSATIGVANTGGRGEVDDDELEQSNVDISAEFSDLIVAQRAFEANSKTVTTFDTVTQDTLSMIR